MTRPHYLITNDSAPGAPSQATHAAWHCCAHKPSSTTIEMQCDRVRVVSVRQVHSAAQHTGDRRRFNTGTETPPTWR